MSGYFFLFILSLNMFGFTMTYKNPYQTLKVGSFHSLSYIYKTYLNLINNVEKLNKTENTEKLYSLKKAYLEIKVSRRKENEDGDDEPMIGLIKVGKQCTFALIIFYFSLLIIYFFLKIACILMKKSYLFLIVNIVIFNILQNFCIKLINDVTIHYILTVILSITFVSLRYSLKNRGKIIEDNSKGYGEFKDDESDNN